MVMVNYGRALCCHQEGRERADGDGIEGTDGETRPVNQRNAGKATRQVCVWKRRETFCFGFGLTDAFHPCAPAQQDICSQERIYWDQYVARVLETNLGDANCNLLA